MIRMGEDAGQELLSKAGPGFFGNWVKLMLLWSTSAYEKCRDVSNNRDRDRNFIFHPYYRIMSLLILVTVSAIEFEYFVC